MPCASSTSLGQLVLPSACAARAGGQRWLRRRVGGQLAQIPSILQDASCFCANSARISIFRTQHVAGVVDALADNYVLSACRAIIPREIGASTFHDAAVARAAFGFAWPRNETLAYHAQPPRDPIFGPAHCDS